MGKLSDRMKMDMVLRNFRPRTQKAYLDQVTQYVRFYGKSPAELGDEEIRRYLYYLKKDRGLSHSTINQAYSALRFFYETTLERNWNHRKVPRGKKPRKLPMVFSKREVRAVFEATHNLKHRAILMTTYSGGLRSSEAVRLKAADIDSDRMLIRVDQGKGQKDRYTLLGDRALEVLRVYYRFYRPQTWLFPGQQADKPIHQSSVGRALKRSITKAGIIKPAGMHTLRHSFATHLLQDGVDLHYIQRLLGHRSPSTTMIYLHLTCKDISEVCSPVDVLGDDDEPQL